MIDKIYPQLKGKIVNLALTLPQMGDPLSREKSGWLICCRCFQVPSLPPTAQSLSFLPIILLVMNFHRRQQFIFSHHKGTLFHCENSWQIIKIMQFYYIPGSSQTSTRSYQKKLRFSTIIFTDFNNISKYQSQNYRNLNYYSQYYFDKVLICNMNEFLKSM